MLPITPLLAAFLFLPVLAHAQPGEDDTSGRVLAIRTVYDQINADSSLRRVVLDEKEWGDGETDGGGKLTGYFNGDTLCRMSLWVSLSYAVVRESYYFSKGALVFVSESEDDFPATGKDYSHLARAFEGRYYFDGDKVFKTIARGKKRMGPDDSHHPLELYHNAHYYYGLLIKKRGNVRLAASH